MNKSGKILFGFCILLLIIALAIISIDQYNAIMAVYSPKELSIKVLWKSMVIYGVFIEPVVILISVSGFFIRKKIGYSLALLYPYFIISYGLISWMTNFPLFGKLAWEQFSYAILVLVPLNIDSTIVLFFKKDNKTNTLVFNLMALIISLSFIIGYFLILK